MTMILVLLKCGLSLALFIAALYAHYRITK